MTYIQVSRELLDDFTETNALINRHLNRAFDDFSFRFEVGRSRITDASKITMWKPWRFLP